MCRQQAPEEGGPRQVPALEGALRVCVHERLGLGLGACEWAHPGLPGPWASAALGVRVSVGRGPPRCVLTAPLQMLGGGGWAPVPVALAQSVFSL